MKFTFHLTTVIFAVAETYKSLTLSRLIDLLDHAGERYCFCDSSRFGSSEPKHELFVSSFSEGNDET